jgi:cation:H+ antiporter
VTALLLLPGALLLYLGAEWFVAGARRYALALGIPPFVIGLTVVAYGTSAPGVVVGVQAAAGGHAAITLASVIGSNIANIGLILGLALVVKPSPVEAPLASRRAPFLLATAIGLPFALFSLGGIGPALGALLVAASVVYTAWMVHPHLPRASSGDPSSEAAAAGGLETPTRRGSLLLAAAGLALLVAGGRAFVSGATSLALDLGMTERLVGLTVVAIGTSLPRLVTSLIAAARGRADLALGAVTASNIFNVLLCLGAASLANRIEGSAETFGADLYAMAVMTVTLAILLDRLRVLSRAVGVGFLAAYGGYLAWLVRGGA